MPTTLKRTYPGASEGQGQRSSQEAFGHLPYAQEHNAGTELQFRVTVGKREIQSDANLWGTLRAIAQEIEEELATSGVNYEDFVFTVEVRPR